MIRDSLAPRKGRSWSLMAALIDPKLEVYRCTRLGEVEYFSDEELAEQPNPAQWEKGQKITSHNVPLRLDGKQAEEMRLAKRVATNFDELKQYYGLENDPALVEPGWADVLIEALSSNGVAILLLFIGGAGLYFEFHTPGLGIGAFVALVCFVLFFWSRFLGGAPGWLISLAVSLRRGLPAFGNFRDPGIRYFRPRRRNNAGVIACTGQSDFGHAAQ